MVRMLMEIKVMGNTQFMGVWVYKNRRDMIRGIARARGYKNWNPRFAAVATTNPRTPRRYLIGLCERYLDHGTIAHEFMHIVEEYARSFPWHLSRYESHSSDQPRRMHFEECKCSMLEELVSAFWYIYPKEKRRQKRKQNKEK